MEYAAKGKKALDDKQYEDAVACYTAALGFSPTSPDYLIQRATALQRAGKYNEALADAENAILNAQKRGKRELIIEGQLRRGCAFFSLQQYGNAEFVFDVVRRMNEKHKMIAAWQGKTNLALEKLAEDDEKRKCTVKETPDAVEGSTDRAPAPAAPSQTGNGTSTPAPTGLVQTPADKIRHEWYQSSDNIYFTLFAKGIPKEDATVDIRERAFDISFPLVNESTYDLTMDPLFGAVVPEKSITRYLPSKMELILAKAVPGQKWATLESKAQPIEVDIDGQKIGTVFRAAACCSDCKPTYPTSSRSGPKDWDKVTREAQKQLLDPSKKNEKGEKKDDSDNDDDLEDGDPANSFFKKLFKDSSPDVRRAMMKSYTESNGTALSTNWDEVKRGKVETQPPTGMEAKQWAK